ncbi:MAG: CsgG/HfaB family protein [Candidatus Brocadiaceae bacterium]
MNNRFLKKKMKYGMVAFCVLLLAGCAATVSQIGVDNWRDYYKPGSTKEEITKNFNLYRGKWWNYYIRGRWYADGSYWDEAVQDFKKAVSFRSADQRSARSYGLHFLEYFVHRELGVVYYHQENYEEAKQELMASLSTADSARAKYYLNKVNEAILRTKKAETEPPQIKISSHAQGEILNTPTIKISGIASGEGYVNNINVQGKRLFIELAEKDLPFSQDVSLSDGDNEIILEATDLLGKRAQRKLSLTLDMHPPAIYLDDVQVHQKDGKQIATVKGTVVDNCCLKYIYINDKEIHLESNSEMKFDEDIVLNGEKKVSIRASDIAGNETRGDEPIDVKATLWPHNMLNHTKYATQHTAQPIRVASDRLDKTGIKTLLASQEKMASQPISGTSSPHHVSKRHGKDKASNPSQDTQVDKVPPVLHTDLKPAIVYNQNLFINIDAHDDTGIAKILVNQTPLDIRQGKHIFVNHLLTLNEGENSICIKAIDTEGNEIQIPPIKITLKTFELLETEARYTAALLPLRIISENGVPSETIYSLLLKAFDEEPRRFNFVERDKAKLEEILREQKFSNTDLASPETAIKIGKIRAAECMLFGSVEEDSKGINLTLRLVDTETTQVLANVDVYDEDKSIKNLEWLTYGLSLKMRQRFPIVQGIVIHTSPKGFHFDAGATSNVGIGMKLLLFREIKEGDIMIKEPLNTIARVSQVQPNSSFAKIISTKDAEKVEKKDLVISK